MFKTRRFAVAATAAVTALIGGLVATPAASAQERNVVLFGDSIMANPTYVIADLMQGPGKATKNAPTPAALIDATARTLLADFLTSRYDDFPTACRALRSAMLATRDGAELISAALIDPTLRAEVTKVLSVAVPESGAVTALHFVMGATVLEQSEYLRLETTGSGGSQSNSSGVSDPILGLENARQAARIQADNQFQEGLGIITRGLNENQR